MRADDALHLPLDGRNRLQGASGRLLGAIYIEVPDWSIEDWSHVEIRARASGAMRNIGLGFNLDPANQGPLPFRATGSRAPIVSDGTVQTYRLPTQRLGMDPWEGPWTHLGIWFNTAGEADEGAIDVLSVRVVRREAAFATRAADAIGADLGTAYTPIRHALFMHAPGRIAYRVKAPEGGRLDVGLGLPSAGSAVTFLVTATRPGRGGADTLLQESRDDRTQWAQRSVDLTSFAGETVTLGLEAESERPGAVALWAAPTVSGSRSSDRPNVIFYVIDGAGADYMSVYGYHTGARRRISNGSPQKVRFSSTRTATRPGRGPRRPPS